MSNRIGGRPRRPRRRPACAYWAASILTTVLVGAWAPQSIAADEPVPSASDTDEVLDLELEDLFDMEISALRSNSRKLIDTPAAIFVLTNEDIRRSGVKSIPEALRMVPGVQVARLSGNRWAISARGFNSLFSDKMLVMIDNRTVYNPTYAGVYWDVQDTLLEDVERIEVIRGPGGTLWGANAVNGVINVVTKSSRDTTGAYLSGGGGNVDHGFTSARYGGAVGESGHYRAYFKYNTRTAFVDPDPSMGVLAYDATEAFRGGFRSDWIFGENTSLTVQGDAYGGDSDATAQSVLEALALPAPRIDTTTDNIGGNVLLRATHKFSETQDLTFQFYYDHYSRDDAVWDESRDTWDLDLQHRFGLPLDTQVIWGLAYRYTSDDLLPGFEVSYDPTERQRNLFTAFLQLEKPFFDEKLRLSAGTKVERNEHVGWVWQPSGRILYTPAERHTLWTAVTGAVRTPSRSTDDLRVEQMNILVVSGNTLSESENLTAIEAGYRTQPIDMLQLDIAGYYNDYDNMLSLEETPGGFAGLPLHWDNLMEGSGYGVEISATLKPVDWWRLVAGYSWAKLDLNEKPGGTSAALEGAGVGIGNPGMANALPRNQFSLRSLVNLPFNFELDGAYYWIDQVPLMNVSSYSRLDLRLGWRPVELIEISFAAQNITNASHKEWDYEFEYTGTLIPRSYYGEVTIRF